MRLSALVPLLLLAALARAAEPGWPQEPLGLFGIELGKPFPGPALIDDCPQFAPFRREPQWEGLCVDGGTGFDADHIPLRNLPLDEVGSEAVVVIREGLVRAIRIDVDPRRYESAREFLIARFGPPHESASAEGPVPLHWVGARATLRLAPAVAPGARWVLELASRP